MILLPRMDECTEGIERIVIALSLANKIRLGEALEHFFARGNLPLSKADDAANIPSAELLGDRLQQVLALGTRGAHALVVLAAQYDPLFPEPRDHTLRATWKAQVRTPLQQTFSGSAFAPLLPECQAIHQRVPKGRVWAALHRHAGDSNVHTNLPLNKDDHEMLQTAHKAVARSLDDVISGEHGIGITKLEFLTDAELQPFADCKAPVDPEGRFNKGKLLRAKPDDTEVRRADLAQAYTSSFGLIGHGSLIMQQSDIGASADSVKNCLRCGKCKPVCATHVPRANLLYSPRNKILATSLLVEAFLYAEQTRRGISVKHWKKFEDVADPLHRLPQVLEPVPGQHRLWRSDAEHAQPVAQDGPKELSPRPRRSHVFPQRDQPRDHQADAHWHGGHRLQGAASGP